MHAQKPVVSRRSARRSIGAALATLMAMAAMLVGAGDASAEAVTAVTFEPDSTLSANLAATWTIGFTPSATGALATGNAVAVTFPAGFDVSAADGSFVSGFTGCSAPTTTVTGQDVFLQLVGGGCTLGAETPAVVEITGISADFDQYDKDGFSVGTYASASFSSAIDGFGASPSAAIDITASLTYSADTSAGTPTDGGIPPVDMSSPSMPVAPDATVLGNTGSLTLAGHTFVGWCTTYDAVDATGCTGGPGNLYEPGDTLTLMGNTLLYSVWEVAVPPTCTPGSYLVGMSCVPAQAGYFVSDAGAVLQVPCPVGYFSASTGATSCTPASLGHYVSVSASTGENACSAGFFTASVASSGCTAAPAGSFVASSGSASAQACAADTFTSTTGSTSCTPCASGTSTKAATGATECTVVVVPDTTPPTAGTLALTWIGSDARIDLTGWDRADIAGWTLQMLGTSPASGGKCPDVAKMPVPSVTDSMFSGTSGTSLKTNYTIKPPKNWCFVMKLTAQDAAGNAASSLTSTVSTVAAAQGVKVTVTLAAELGLSSSQAFQNQLILDLAEAAKISASRFTIVQLQAGSAASRAAASAPARMFTFSTKRLNSKQLRAKVTLTKAGKAYLARYPKLRGTRVKMTADFVVTLKSGGAPVTVRRTFKMRLPK